MVHGKAFLDHQESKQPGALEDDDVEPTCNMGREVVWTSTNEDSAIGFPVGLCPPGLRKASEPRGGGTKPCRTSGSQG